MLRPGARRWVVRERSVRAVPRLPGLKGPFEAFEEGGEERPPWAARGSQRILPVDVLRRSEEGPRVSAVPMKRMKSSSMNALDFRC